MLPWLYNGKIHDEPRGAAVAKKNDDDLLFNKFEASDNYESVMLAVVRRTKPI
jgi:hypothetical protein